MVLTRSDFFGTIDSRVASESVTGKKIDFFYDFESGESWFVYRDKGTATIAKTLDEAIDLWNNHYTPA